MAQKNPRIYRTAPQSRVIHHDNPRGTRPRFSCPVPGPHRAYWTGEDMDAIQINASVDDNVLGEIYVTTRLVLTYFQTREPEKNLQEVSEEVVDGILMRLMDLS